MLLNAKEAAARLGIPRRTFDKHRAMKVRAYRFIEAKEPMGQRKFIAEELDKINQGQNLIQLVRRGA